MPRINIFLKEKSKFTNETTLLTVFEAPMPNMDHDRYDLTMTGTLNEIIITYHEKPNYELNKTLQEIDELERRVERLKKKAWELQQ